MAPDGLSMEETPHEVRTFRTGNEEETRDLAARLSRLLVPGDVLLLAGELGTGKTCFVKGLAEGLGVQEKVLSPTFTLLREYRGRVPLYHLDAYRLKGPEDLFDLGLEEYLGGEGILAVEWGDRVRGFFKEEYLEVEISFAGETDERRIRLLPGGSSWERRLRRLDGGDP